MKVNPCIVAAALLAVSGAAMAGDSPGSMSSDHQAMKACMQQQKANNSGASKEDMHKACMAQIKSKADSVPNQTTPTTSGEPAPQSGSEMNPPTNPPK